MIDDSLRSICALESIITVHCKMVCIQHYDLWLQHVMRVFSTEGDSSTSSGHFKINTSIISFKKTTLGTFLVSLFSFRIICFCIKLLARLSFFATIENCRNIKFHRNVIISTSLLRIECNVKKYDFGS